MSHDQKESGAVRRDLEHEMRFPIVEMKNSGEFVEKIRGKGKKKTNPQNKKYPERRGWL